MATLSEISDSTELRDAIAWQEATIARESAASLADYLGHVVIDSRPETQSWGFCIEPWQEQIVAPMLPAIEHMAGVRDHYEGPRSFFLVLPRGHDKTSLAARLANWAVGYAKRPIMGIAAASTREQAALLLDAMKAELRLNPWLSSRLRSQNFVMLGAGGKLRVISADAPHSSGLKADLIICDELTFWDNRELFDILYSGREKRPSSVFIIITNAGLRGSWQWELLHKAKCDTENWHVFEALSGQQLASWMSPSKIESMRTVIPRGHARRVLDNHWIDATESPLLQYEVIQSAFADCLWLNGEMPRGERPNLYLGVDIGRTHDRTVIWTIELVNEIAWTREVKVLEAKPFAEQKREILKRINHHVRAIRIDKGGIGYQLAEELETEFRSIAEGVQLNGGKQGQLALAFKTAFIGRKIKIPEDQVLAADLQLIEEVETGTNGVPTLKTLHGPSGHGDRFWAGALAFSGIPFERPRQYASRPRVVIPRWAWNL